MTAVTVERIPGIGTVRHELTAPALTLMQEIVRYLSAVDAFRQEGAEPTWRRETSC